MHGINLNMFINEDYIFILRNNSLLKYTQDYVLVESKYCKYSLVKEYENTFYLYDGTNIYKSKDLDLIEVSKYKEVGNIKDFHIYNKKIYLLKDNQIEDDQREDDQREEDQREEDQREEDQIEEDQIEEDQREEDQREDDQREEDQREDDKVSNNKIEDIHYWDNQYLYYNSTNGIYKIDLIHKQSFMLSNIQNVSCIYAHKNMFIYSTNQGKIFIQGEEERTLHKHDNPIIRIYINKNILYILTKDNKFSILDMYRDSIRYITEYSSTNIKIERYKDEIYILNEFEFVKYDIQSGTQIIKYNIPNIEKVFIVDDLIEEGEVSLTPVYHYNDECDLIIKYRNNLICTKDLIITSVYNIKNTNIFYTNGYICVQLKNRIEVYRRGSNKLYFVRNLKTMENISDIKEEDGVFYYVVGDSLIKSSIINLKVGKLKNEDDAEIPQGYDSMKLLGDFKYLVKKNVLDIYDKHMKLVRNIEIRRCIREVVKEGIIIDERGELINY
jgi:hypothetical protein